MFKRDWSTPSSINNYSTLNSEHNCKDLYIQLKKNQQTCKSDNQGRSDFQYGVCKCFIIDLLMQHEFVCVNEIGRSWRTWKMNQITPAYSRKKQFMLIIYRYTRPNHFCCHLHTWNIFSL